MTINVHDIACFGTIRNSTALKHQEEQREHEDCFGTIRNSTALKQLSCQ